MTDRLLDFEDYQKGEKGVTVPRTVSEADIVNYACLTADYSQLHMDRHYAADNIYGSRIAHGLLASSFMTGMLSLDAPHVLGRSSPKAYLCGMEVDYREVLKLGDTIHTLWHIIEKASDLDHEGFGLVRTSFQVLNQEGISVCDGTITTKVGKKQAHYVELPLKPIDPWVLTGFVPNVENVYYAEDYTTDGEDGETEGRTITEADIANFAGLTGDYNPLHVDSEFAKNGIFRERIAHGMLCFDIAFSYWLREWSRFPRPGSGVAGHLNDKIAFLAPVKIGDTIRCRYKTISSRLSGSKPQLGLVTFGLQVINQRTEVVQEGSVIMMMPSKAGLGK